MDALTAFEAIRKQRNARNIWNEDPLLTPDDVAYREGRLLSTREWPEWVGTPRRGRSLPPSRNLGEAAE